MPRLSIIIPTLNEEKYLPRLLESIKKQTFNDYEVVVADAHSKDRTREIAERFGARVVGGGLPSKGRNLGTKAAKGEVFLFLDADVVLPRLDFLARTLREFDQRKLDIATSLLKPLSKKVIDYMFYGIYNVYTYTVQKVHPHIPGFFIFVRRKVHEKIGGFDETLDFAEDHEYARRATKVGRFGFLHAGLMPVSTRRFDRDGYLSIAVKYLLGEMYLLRHGRVPKGAIDYGWGYDKIKKREFLKELRKMGNELWENGKYLLRKRR